MTPELQLIPQYITAAEVDKGRLMISAARDKEADHEPR